MHPIKPRTPNEPKTSRTIIIIISLVLFALFSVSRQEKILQELNGSINGLQPQRHAVVSTSHETIHDSDSGDETANVTLSIIPATSAAPVAFDPKNLCSAFSGTSRATRLWKKHLEQIIETAKMMPDDDLPKIRELIQTTLTPARMRRAVQHLPSFHHRQLQHIVNILQKRLQDSSNNPPLRIAVFGGSVTIGRGCVEGRMQHKECAWPNRFERLVNTYFGKEIIKVYNLALGGTNSNSGTNMIKYWMYPDKTLKTIGPDVIINSYSTNDMLPPWGKKWPEDDLIALTKEQVHNNLERFIRETLTSKPPCETAPLIVHVDDYLGPQQPALLGELAYVSEMTQLAKYYDTVAISYAEVVRDIAYMDHTETNFHKHKDVHYGRIAHTTIALSVAFASLELLINYCDDTYNNDSGNDLTPDDFMITKQQMKDDKLFLPPPLNKELLQANATKEYEAALEDSYQKYTEHPCVNTNTNETNNNRNPCTIAWISTPHYYTAKDITKFMNTYQIGTNDGWEAESQQGEGWSNKEGWVATKPNATFTLKFPASSIKNVKTVTVYFLRSYGDKWKDSNTRFTIRTSGALELATRSIAGVHADNDYKYSLTLSETIVLSQPVPVGDDLTIAVDLVGGSHFKLMGLMLCTK